MALKHKKVSGQANTDPAKVGGADWDDAHVYGPGSLFVAARFWILCDTVTTTYSGGVSKEGTGYYWCSVDVPSLPMASGATVRYESTYNMYVYGGIPAGWVYNIAIDETTDYIEVGWEYNGSNADPTFYWRFGAITVVEVM